MTNPTMPTHRISMFCQHQDCEKKENCEPYVGPDECV